MLTGPEFKARREAVLLGQAALGQLAGVSEETVRNVEKGLGGATSKGKILDALLEAEARRGVTHTAEAVGGGDESPVIEGGLTVGERGEVVDALVEVGGQLVGIGERLVALAEKLATGGTP